MARHINRDDYTRNRIGDWIDNAALEKLRRDEEALAQEKDINVQKLRENHNKQEQIYRGGLSRLVSEMEALKKELKEKIEEEKRICEKEILNLKVQIAELVKKNNELSERVQELVRELNKITFEKRHNAQIAIKYYQLAVSKYQEIVSDEKCIKFSKGKIDRLEHLLSKFNAPDLSLEAQQAIAITILSDIHQLKHHSEREYMKFIPKYELLVNHVDCFISSLNETICLDDSSELDINHWTNNEFSELKKDAESLKVHVESGLNAFDYQTQQIKEDEDLLAVLAKQKEILIAQAKSKAVRSHQILIFGETLQRTVVEKEKFSKRIFQFENNDDRGVFVVELVRESDKKKLTFLFIQDSNKPFSPLCIFRQGSYISHSEYQNFCKRLHDSLEQLGINVLFLDPKLSHIRYEDETFVSGKSQICNDIHNIIDINLNKTSIL